MKKIISLAALLITATIIQCSSSQPSNSHYGDTSSSNYNYDGIKLMLDNPRIIENVIEVHIKHQGFDPKTTITDLAQNIAKHCNKSAIEECDLSIMESSLWYNAMTQVLEEAKQLVSSQEPCSSSTENLSPKRFPDLEFQQNFTFD